jgi:hypothetical protein
MLDQATLVAKLEGPTLLFERPPVDISQSYFPYLQSSSLWSILMLSSILLIIQVDISQ